MKRIVSSLFSLTCLFLLSLPAQAHTLTAAIATPDCDSQTIKLTFSGVEMENAEFSIQYTVNFSALDGGPPVPSITDTLTLPASVLVRGPYSWDGPVYDFNNVMVTIPVPALAGRTLEVSGSATLIQLGRTWNTAPLTDASGATTFEVNCAPPVAALGDFVWEDENGNGIQNSGEPGIPGVSVSLNDCAGNAVVDANGALVGPTTTDSNGFYQFGNLSPGTYCVSFDKDTADTALDCTSEFTLKDAGADDVDSNANADGSTDPVSLAAGQYDDTIDAGLYCPASLGDFVWNDLDRDGVQGADEPGLNGVLVSLLDCDGNTLKSTQTMDGGPTDTGRTSGFYEFTGLAPGCYVVNFEAPGGFVFSEKGQGGNPALDSNAMGNGMTDPVTLASGERNPTIDAGVNQPPTAQLGDFVWEDCNANGIQDDITDPDDPSCRGGGIPGVPVSLQSCTGDPIRSTVTGDDGGYLFEDLDAGCYQVAFDVGPVQCDFGSAEFTLFQAGNDPAFDSNAGPGGVSPDVNLAVDEVNRTIDAGVVCPAKVGDFVWNDDVDGDGIGNGIQEDGEPGIEGVEVRLIIAGANGQCDADDPFETTFTNADGIYMFLVDPGAKYCVEVLPPAGTVFTLQNQGNDPAKDSDVNPATGRTGLIMVPSNTYDPTWDAGVTSPPPCGIALEKSCEIVTPPPTQGFTCNGKVDSLTMRLDESLGLTVTGVTAYAGPVGSTTLPVIRDGNEFTVSGYQSAGAPNDVTWVVASSAGPLESVFHLSCSDSEMDGETDVPEFPNDCARPQGNGKGNDAGDGNIWLLEGMATNEGDVLDCTPPDPGPTTSDCSFEAQYRACGPDISFKPEMLTFAYSGGDCTATSNGQEPGKVICDDFGALPDDVRIITDGGFTFDVSKGETFTVKRDKADKMWIYDANGTLLQQLEIHTSCSQLLQTGDVYGGVTLIGMDGAGLGSEVDYAYLVKNNGTGTITSIAVTDTELGFIGSADSLASGDTTTFLKRAFITETTVNKATATGQGLPGAFCLATDMAKVTVTPPAACSVSAAFEKVEDDKVKWFLTNTSAYKMVRLETFLLNYREDLYGLIKEIKLDGTIYKLDDFLKLYPEGKGSGDLIVESEWTQADGTKRDLYPGETRRLEIVFNQKFPKEDADPSDFFGSVSFNGGECGTGLSAP